MGFKGMQEFVHHTCIMFIKCFICYLTTFIIWFTSYLAIYLTASCLQIRLCRRIAAFLLRPISLCPLSYPSELRLVIGLPSDKAFSRLILSLTTLRLRHLSLSTSNFTQ